jgi:alkylation response protein AidB-like acyl-CoA dehydrogenase
VEADDRSAFVRVVRDFIERHVQDQAGVLDERAQFPRAALGGLAALGATALTVPLRHGGIGADTQTYVEVLEEIAAGSIALAGTYMVHMTVTSLLAGHGTDAQIARWLPRLLDDSVGAMAMTEADAGSDLRGIRGTATDTEDGFRLNATKMFITSGGEADVYVVLLRHGEGTSLFVVERGTPGLSFGPPLRKMGYSGSPTTAVVLDDVLVERDRLLGVPGKGLQSMLATLDHGRIGVGAMAVGLARRALDVAYGYLCQRRQFGQELIEFQGLQFMAADMRIQVEAARQLVRLAAATRDAGERHTEQAAMAKLFATDAAMRVTTDAVQLLGGYGYTREYPVERYMREAKMLQIVEGTNQIQRVVISRQMRELYARSTA